MELKPWILKQLKEFKSLIIYRGTGEKSNSLFFEDAQDYDKIVEKYGEHCFRSCIAIRGNFNYYICWTEQVEYIFQVVENYNIGSKEGTMDRYFYKNVFGNSNWLVKLMLDYAPLFWDCGNCNCYNDFIVTGNCVGHIEGVSIWN